MHPHNCPGAFIVLNMLRQIVTLLMSAHANVIIFIDSMTIIKQHFIKNLIQLGKLQFFSLKENWKVMAVVSS